MYMNNTGNKVYMMTPVHDLLLYTLFDYVVLSIYCQLLAYTIAGPLYSGHTIVYLKYMLYLCPYSIINFINKICIDVICDNINYFCYRI